nr:efflux RND transporter periplasmic adaptor subunit [uncultured Bacteroides sp.]
MKKREQVYALALLFLVVSCKGKKEEATADEAIPVKVETVSTTTAAGEHNYVGTVEENTGSSLSFSVMGTVEKVLVTEGQSVSKGQLLAVLNKATLMNTYNAAHSSLKQAQDAYKRLTQLHESGSLPEIKYVEIQTQLQQAEATESIAKKNLRDCNLYAPFSGVIARKSIDPGMNVVLGFESIKLVTIDKVNVKVSVPENEIARVKKGATAQVDVAALDHKSFEGKIDEKGVIANPLSHTYEIKVKLNNPHRELMPGMVCEVYISSSDQQQGGILVPNSAIQILDSGERFVWLAKNGKATRRIVGTGALTNQGVVVTSGLSSGDQVIVEGNQKVSEGMKITVK